MLNFEFLPAHISTLAKLEALCERHGCHITFATNAEASVDISDLISRVGLSQEAQDFLESHFPSDTLAECSGISFTLHNSNPSDCDPTYNYIRYEIEGQLDEDDWAEAAPTVRDELESEIGEGYFRAESTEEHAYGFKGDAAKGGCYRAGMALKYFGDMVCDQLGEPRIVDTY
jgi:hypothetical protein